MDKTGDELMAKTALEIKKIGKEVLKVEIDAMQKLRTSIGADFIDAVQLLKATYGRVVVTGMGKSGHIARKISSTFSSIGKQSFFVHPAEASHGDLGMIDTFDTVVAISNSGETAELFDILHYCKRNNIRIIGITSKKDSTLDNAATISLILPKFDEACPFGLAPTTSTTLSLALGDALAVAIYAKTFSPLDFSQFHPGGKIGSRLLKVANLMHTGKEMPIIDIDDTVGEAIVEITNKALGCVGILDGEKLAGIITDGDFRRHIDKVTMKCPVSKIMSRKPLIVQGDLFAVDALTMMNSKKITSLFVVEGGHPVGVVHIHDLLRAGVDN